MAISQQQLAAAIGAARGVMKRADEMRPTSSRRDPGAPLPPPSYNTSIDEAWGVPSDLPLATSYSQPIQENYGGLEPGAEYDQTSFTDAQISGSQLPDAIKKSFLEERISNGSGNISVLDQMNIKPQPTPVARPVHEQKQQFQPSYGGFDYTAMKAIIKECLNEYFESNSLNEGALKTIKINKGKINLVDSKGNLFTAVLESKGNINDKK